MSGQVGDASRTPRETISPHRPGRLVFVAQVLNSTAYLPDGPPMDCLVSHRCAGALALIATIRSPCGSPARPRSFPPRPFALVRDYSAQLPTRDDSWAGLKESG